MSADEGLVRIGRVIKPHGIRGELVVAAEGQTLAELPVGTAVLVAAVASAMVGLDLREIADWAFEVFSVTFMVILGIMLAGFAYCLVRLIECRKDGENGDVWLEAAVHLAGGVATVALTYTLLGISLGIGTLADEKPVKMVGSFWPYAPTLFDYIRRAMPLAAPQSLSDDQVYALTAYLLAANGLIDEDRAMTAATLPEVRMPNRDGFVEWWPDPPG